jgi:O-antigen ligase
MSDTVLTTWWESKLARRLDLVAGSVAIVLLCTVALEEDLAWVFWLVGAAIVVFLTMTRWPYGALLTLTVMSVMPRFFVEVFGWKARPEHFAAAIICVVLGVRVLRHKSVVKFDKLDYWILAYVAINYVSSAFESSAPSTTLRWALQNNLGVVPYFLVRFLVRDVGTLEKAFRMLLGIGIAECVYGILCYLSLHAFGTTGGMEIGQYFGDVAAPFGSMYEPNLFGAYAGCCAVMFLALYMLEGQNRTSSLVCFLIASLATVLSFSRAALLALVVASGWVLWKARSGGSGGRRALWTIVLGAALIMFVAASTFGDVLRERFNNLFYQGLTEETTITRFIVIEEALREIPNHPILGSGTASFNLSFDWARYVPEWGSDKTWIGNTPLRILHDTGLLGLTAILGFFVSIWRKIRPALRGGISQVPALVALSAGTLLYCISFQSTDGSVLAFTWVHLGFLASAALLLKGTSRNDLTRGEA